MSSTERANFIDLIVPEKTHCQPYISYSVGEFWPGLKGKPAATGARQITNASEGPATQPCPIGCNVQQTRVLLEEKIHGIVFQILLRTLPIIIIFLSVVVGGWIEKGKEVIHIHSKKTRKRQANCFKGHTIKVSLPRILIPSLSILPSSQHALTNFSHFFHVCATHT